MEIIINGKKETVEHATVAHLLAGRGLDPEVVVVEMNGRILPKSVYPSAMLKDGDILELVSFVAGG